MRFRSVRSLRLAVALFVSVAISPVVLTGCGGGGGNGNTNSPSPTRGVTVLVQDAFTKSPISNASVRIGSQSLTTNSNGTVNASFPTEWYQLVVSKQGYQTFSTYTVCFDGAQIIVRLTPTLTPVTDETFHERSNQVFDAAEELREAIDLVRFANENTVQDVLVLFESASNAFMAAMSSMKNYSPTKSQNRQAGLIDFLRNFLSLTKVSQGTEQMVQLKRKLLSGEDVPEIDAWLANHPFHGARSVRELKEMYPGAEAPMLERLFIVYQQSNPTSGFNMAMDGAKDIWTAQFPNLLDGVVNLIGWGINKVWSGAGKVIVITYNVASLVLEYRKQIAWLWDKAKNQLMLVKVENNQPVTLPQATVDIVVSNGKAHKPSVVTNYQISGGTQTLNLTPQPISGTPPPSGTKVYIGQFSGSRLFTNNLGTWNHQASLTLRLELPEDPENEDGRLIVNGNYSVNLVALAPGVTSVEPSQANFTITNATAKTNYYYGNPASVTGEVTATVSDGSISGAVIVQFGGKIVNGEISADVTFVGGVASMGSCAIEQQITLKRQ